MLAKLQELPEVDRAALLMRAEDQLPYEEIARALGLTLSATKVKIHRARLRLAEARLRVPEIGELAMKLDPEVIRDLLPLYLAGEASPATRRLVDEHLAADPELARLARAAADPEVSRLRRRAAPPAPIAGEGGARCHPSAAPSPLLADGLRDLHLALPFTIHGNGTESSSSSCATRRARAALSFAVAAVPLVGLLARLAPAPGHRPLETLLRPPLGVGARSSVRVFHVVSRLKRFVTEPMP